MTLKYRLILLLASLVAVLTFKALAANPPCEARSVTIEKDKKLSPPQYKTLLFVQNGVDSINKTEAAIYKYVDEYYIDWHKFYKRFYEQAGKEIISSKYKKRCKKGC